MSSKISYPHGYLKKAIILTFFRIVSKNKTHLRTICWFTIEHN